MRIDHHPIPAAHQRQSIGGLSKLTLAFVSVIVVAFIIFDTDVEEFSGYTVIPSAPFLCPVFPQMAAYALEAGTVYLAFQDSGGCGAISKLPRDRHYQNYVFAVSDAVIGSGKTTSQAAVQCDYAQQSNIIDLNAMPALGAGAYAVSGQTNDTRWGMCKFDIPATTDTPATVTVRLTSQSNHTRTYTIPLSPVSSASFFKKETISDTIWVTAPATAPDSDAPATCYCIDR
jgi:hypothetical protein